MNVKNKDLLLLGMLILIIIDIYLISLYQNNPEIIIVLSILFSLTFLGILINDLTNKKNSTHDLEIYSLIFFIVLSVFNIKISLDQVNSIKISKLKALKQKHEDEKNKQIQKQSKIENVLEVAYPNRFRINSKYIHIKNKATIYKDKQLSTFLTESEKGDKFEIIGKNGDIYEVYMFSGDIRYLKSSKNELINIKNEIMPSKIIQERIYDGLARAQDCANYYSDKLKENTKYGRYLEDLFSLQIIRENNLIFNPIIINKIKSNGTFNNWKIKSYEENINLCGYFSI